MGYRYAKLVYNTRIVVENRERNGRDTVGAVRNIDMSFHSAMSASHKLMGYRSDNGAIRRKVWKAKWSCTRSVVHITASHNTGV